MLTPFEMVKIYMEMVRLSSENMYFWLDGYDIGHMSVIRIP